MNYITRLSGKIKEKKKKKKKEESCPTGLIEGSKDRPRCSCRNRGRCIEFHALHLHAALEQALFLVGRRFYDRYVHLVQTFDSTQWPRRRSLSRRMHLLWKPGTVSSSIDSWYDSSFSDISRYLDQYRSWYLIPFAFNENENEQFYSFYYPFIYPLNYYRQIQLIWLQLRSRYINKKKNTVH